MQVPEILVQQINDPPEPIERNVGGLIQYIIEQKRVNAQQNQDKAAIIKFQKGTSPSS